MNCKFCQQFMTSYGDFFTCQTCHINLYIRNDVLVYQVYRSPPQFQGTRFYIGMNLRINETSITYNDQALMIDRVFPDTHPSKAEELVQRLLKLKGFL